MSRKNKREAVIEEDGSEDEEEPTHARDYITLKNRATKQKLENEEGLLEYYTTEKYNDYFRTLTPIKDSFTPYANAEIKEMEKAAELGHNICVFGSGSKISLLKKLKEKTLSNFHCFEIKGYLPSVSDKKIHNHFGGALIDLHLIDKIESVTIKEQSEEYKKILREHDNARMVVLLHSIDGPNLFNVESQQRLAELFNSPHIQLVCSLDSMRTVMLWSPITLQKFKFIFFHIDTHQPYIEEFRHRPLKSETKQSTQDSLVYIWQSLNRNQKQIVKFIAEYELKNVGLDEMHSKHYTFNELLDVCIDEIVLSSDHQLRQNLLELLDHKIIIDRLDERQNKRIYMTKYEKRILDKILDFKIE